MRRRSFAKCGAIVVTVGCLMSITLAEASPASTTLPPSHSTAAWRLTSDHTSSRAWSYIDLGKLVITTQGYNVRSAGVLAMTASLSLSGAPVQIGWQDNGRVESPRTLTFAPRPNDGTFSYTFFDLGKRLDCGHTLRLLWRSPTGRRVDLTSGNVVVNYQPAANDTGICT